MAHKAQRWRADATSLTLVYSASTLSIAIPVPDSQLATVAPPARSYMI